ncbi:SNF-domain-containing protein [Fragilariopsis cylindrus CCMP1102]|uniref:SNF-domain-containing protein n=1 Tax=Fragilariopsis cylindrus CCMP1102 TaxID=635003 RepID=A0A1E7F8I9_9STRA|nr:SNF-domain-containing protein [Fragilariopsis cylindrus CCMP1102]|eukprot:OEU14466.1 SNF-domain-containing protein [Fragilariopsis cylindrus CCMP1102]
MSDETKVSWSGTLTLVILWGIGPFVYLCIYLVNLMKRKYGGGIENLEAVEEAVVPSKKGEEDSTTIAETDYGGKSVQNWTSTQYLFSLIGYAIGIGNVWRFCYVIAQDGGSASLFAYIICTIFVATPLFMYEMILGQYLRLHAANAWQYIKPRYQGLAISQFVMLLIAQSYFVMIIGYTVPYMIGSCSDPLPWTIHPSGSEGYWTEHVLGLKETVFSDDTDGSVSSSLEEVDGLSMQWSLVGSLLFVWIVVFFSISFGKSILADITYVTVCAPVVLMVILIIRTAFLPGAVDGISFYIGKFEASKLGEAQVWANALSQCLFSLSPGFGTAITLSATTTKTEDVYRAAIITSVANTVFAFASGLAVFAMVGNIAYTSGRDVAEVASSGGQGLAFIVIASAMPTFGGAANAFSAMFFFMLFTLGLDSSFCWAETLTASVEDFIPKEKRPRTWIISLFTCSVSFLIGLPYATTKGNLILDGVDFFVGINFLLLVCFVESIVFNFDFGFKRLEYALQKATSGMRSLRPAYLCCRFDFHLMIPAATFGLFLFQMIQTIIKPYLPNNPNIEAIGWACFAVCFAMLFIGFQKFSQDGSLKDIPDDYPYDGTVEERKVYWANFEDDENKKVDAKDDDNEEIGGTGDPSDELGKTDDPASNNYIVDKDSVELDA